MYTDLSPSKSNKSIRELSFNLDKFCNGIFFKKNKCENDNRNLKYIRIVGNEVKKYNISEKFKNKYGMWLIGYDGQIKSYSSDISLLKEIYNIVDKMPLRKKEILEQKIKCDW